jgi:hypothetical protein
MEKIILLSVFGIVSIILFSFSSRSFLRKSVANSFEITNGTGERIDSLAIFSHGSDIMHLVVLEGGALEPNEKETFTIDGVEGDYYIVFHEINGKYFENDFAWDARGVGDQRITDEEDAKRHAKRKSTIREEERRSVNRLYHLKPKRDDNSDRIPERLLDKAHHLQAPMLDRQVPNP